MRTILTALFRHETNRLAPGVTDFEDFEKRYAVYGEKAVRERLSGAREEMNAVFDYFDPLGEYCVKPILALNASPGPVVSQRVFDDTCGKLLAAVREQPVDGILLCLHGAMVTEDSEDGEGQLLAALRHQVGEDIPIMATLDLHANITQRMVDNATALFAYYCNPHTDSYETAMRACECMHKTLEGQLQPVMDWKNTDFLLPVTPTAHSAMAPFVQKAKALSIEKDMIDVSICHGFYLSDIRDMGLSVLSVSDKNKEKAKQTAEKLAEELFAARKQFDKKTLSCKEAVRIAMASERFPVVLADVADNPGCGASVDSTELLRELIDAGARDTAFAVMYDPKVAQQAKQAGIGSAITVELGGKTVPMRTGGPVRCNAVVKGITDGQFRNRDEMAQGLLMKFGLCALLDIEGIQVIVCSVRAQPWDLEIYRHIGIQPEKRKILVVKSAAHFRASFSKVAASIYEVSAPGLAHPMPAEAGLCRVRRPIYPLDDI